MAHIKGLKGMETISEHIRLVMDYARKIILEQNIDPVIDRLISDISPNEQESAEFIKLLFTGSIVYHDLGKINPNFQVEQMNNPQFQKTTLSIEHQHSILSAYLFLHYFSQIINASQFEKKSKMLLFGVAYLFCIPILKHHSHFIGNEIPFKEDLFDELFIFLNQCGIEIPKNYSRNLLKGKDQWIEQIDKEKRFALFALLKLSYSLLTACDYYATNEYMAGIKVNEFGILNQDLKQKIIHNFKSLKPYNSDLFSHFDEFADKPFSELQERNNANLNFLRQKLNAEAITSLKANPDAHWYYIEAPTGAGKTNLSLACIAELLQADKNLNKVFYVFPFTTLITQTFQSIQETVGLNGDEIIQLHSKAGFNSKGTGDEADAQYGDEKRLYVDTLFVNYPFCVTSHIRFFDILKGNSKGANYLLHRLCNSIVIMDELQTYNPKHWDKIVFFIENYARLLNMRFIIMSATLPKIDALSDTARGNFISLISNKKSYFTNQNFAGRVEFDFSLLDDKSLSKLTKDAYLVSLADFMKDKVELYFLVHDSARILVEFITKNTASHFYRLIKEKEIFDGYKCYLISGDILEPRRKEVISDIKTGQYKKIIVVSTQVVEAGVDIDMDIGFKDRSLLDSDEQFAGRINRNALKSGCKVFLFHCDNAKTIYGQDDRYKHQQKDEDIYFGFKEILRNKTFDTLYQKVFEDSKKADWTDAGKLDAYLSNFTRFDFESIDKDFQLIEKNETQQLFIPLEIKNTGEYPVAFLEDLEVLSHDGQTISGEKLFERYMSIIENRDTDFSIRQIHLKKIAGLMAQFTISVYPRILKELADKLDPTKEIYGYQYLLHWDACYNLKTGFDFEKAKNDIYL